MTAVFFVGARAFLCTLECRRVPLNGAKTTLEIKKTMSYVEKITSDIEKIISDLFFALCNILKSKPLRENFQTVILLQINMLQF